MFLAKIFKSCSESVIIQSVTVEYAEKIDISIHLLAVTVYRILVLELSLCLSVHQCATSFSRALNLDYSVPGLSEVSLGFLSLSILSLLRRTDEALNTSSCC